MKTLTLIRHAHAGSGIQVSDLDRALSDRGHAEAKQQSILFPFPDDAVLLISPARRTQETAGHWLKKQPHLKSEMVKTLYNADFETILEALEAHHDCEHVVVFSHNPGISEVYHYLTDNWVAFEPCTVATLALNESKNTLERGNAAALQLQFPSQP